MSPLVHFDAQFNKNSIPALGQGQLMYAYFEVRPGQADSQTRLPLNFTLVLDKSGSMAGDRMIQLKTAVHTLIDQLQPDDHIAIIAFNATPQTVVEATTAADKKTIHDAVDALKATGLTKMAPAMDRGLQEVMKHVAPHRASRLIILTDGQTEGEAECVAQASQAGQMGVPIVALGLGSDWNEDLLLELAHNGAAPGYGDQIKTPDDINQIFAEMMTQMAVVAQNVALRLLMVQGVEARRVWQVMPLIKDISFGVVQGQTVSVHLPELSESGAAYLIEMIIPPRQNGRYRFAQAEVSYVVPNGGEQKERRDMTLEVSPTAYADQQVNRHIMDTVERVTAFKLQTQALEEAAVGNIANATRKLREAHTRLLSQGELEQAQTVLEEAQRLEQGQGLSNQGKKTIRLQSRKTVRLSDL